jgi:hypothetical protein
VIRAALLRRRHQRFWFNHLKSVQQPCLQYPHCPKRPPPPEVQVVPSLCAEQMALFHDQMPLADVQLLTFDSSEPILAHRMMLSVSSELFKRLFQRISTVALANSENLTTCEEEPLQLNLICSDCTDLEDPSIDAETSNCSTDDNDRHFCFLPETLSDETGQQTCLTHATGRPRLRSTGGLIQLKHSAIVSLKVLTSVKENVSNCCDSCHDQSPFVYQVRLSDQISREALQQCVQFAYTGRLADAETYQTSSEQLLQTAQLLQFPDLITLLHQNDQLNCKIDFSNAAWNKSKVGSPNPQFQKILFGLHQSALNHEFTGRYRILILIKKIINHSIKQFTSNAKQTSYFNWTMERSAVTSQF